MNNLRPSPPPPPPLAHDIAIMPQHASGTGRMRALFSLPERDGAVRALGLMAFMALALLAAPEHAAAQTRPSVVSITGPETHDGMTAFTAATVFSTEIQGNAPLLSVNFRTFMLNIDPKAPPGEDRLDYEPRVTNVKVDPENPRRYTYTVTPNTEVDDPNTRAIILRVGFESYAEKGMPNNRGFGSSPSMNQRIPYYVAATIVDDAGAGDEDDTTITGNVIAGDPEASNAGADTGLMLTVARYASGTDIDTTPVTAGASESGDHGSLVITAAGAYTYTVADSNNSLPAGTNNTDVFTYETSDSMNAKATGTLTITIAGVNDAPAFANAIPAQTASEGQALSYEIPGNTFADPDEGDTLTYTATLANGDPLPAWLMLSTAGMFSNDSVPDGAAGSYSISVTATDSAGAASAMPATFTYTIGAKAMAVDDEGEGDEDDGTITGNVITGDPGNSDAGADTGVGLLVVSYAFGSRLADQGGLLRSDHGSLVITVQGAFTYTIGASNNSLRAGASNTEVFTYTITDNINNEDASDTGTLTITINGVNDAPVLTNAIPAQSAIAGRMFSYPIPGNTFVDPEAGDTLRYKATLANGDPLPTWLMLSTSGTFSSARVAASAAGSYSISVTATDSASTDSVMPATFTLTVTKPLTAVDDAGAGDEDDTTITGNVITGDPDNSNAGADQGSGLTVTRYAAGSSIAMTPVNATASEGGDHGSLVITAQGAFTYTVGASNNSLRAGMNNVDTFTYEIKEENDVTDTGTLTITITGVNDAPASASAPAITNAVPGEMYTFDLNTLFTDAEDDTLMFTLGACDPAFVRSGTNLVGSDSGSVPADTTGGGKSCSVTASDGNGGTRTVNFNVTVAELVAVNDAVAGDEDDRTITGNVIAGDPGNSNAGADQGSGLTVTRYAAGSSITMTPVNANAPENGSHGSLVITATGAFTYTVAASNNDLTSGQSNSDVFTYEIQDDGNETSTGTLTVTISGVNDVPGLAGRDMSSGVVGQAYSLELDTVFTDAEGTDLTYQIASAQGGCDAAFTLTGTRRSMLIGSGGGGIIPEDTAPGIKACALVVSDGANQPTLTLRIDVRSRDNAENVRNILAGYARTLGWDAVDAIRKRAAVEGEGGPSMDVSGLMDHLRTVAESKSSGTDATGNVAGLPHTAGRADFSHAGYRDGARGAGSSLQFWANASNSSFDDEMNGFTNDGDLSTVRAGFEKRRDSALLGLAVSHAWGDSRFRTMDGQTGESDFDQWMVTPYIARTSGAMRTWGLLGLGTGTLDYSVGEGAARRTASSDTQAYMAAGGMEYRMPSEILDITARAEGMYSGLEADATELYEKTSAWTRGARGEIEIAMPNHVWRHLLAAVPFGRLALGRGLGRERKRV